MNDVSFLPIILVGFINIALFYFNYFYLIPRFLFTKKYLNYSFLFFFCLMLSLALAFFIFEETGTGQGALAAVNPILTLVRHTAKGYAFQMLVVSFVTSLALAYGNRLKQIEQEKHSAQIASLKSQINPHFLFNTINNIDVLIKKDADKASQYLNKLSHMMRFMLYETNTEKIDLKNELSYIESYIELQKIRTTNANYVNYKISGDTHNLQIEPMLFIPFIENAFKHAENKKIDNAVNVSFDIEKNMIRFTCENAYSTETTLKPTHSGLGNDLIKRRLALLYPNNHTFTIEDKNGNYKVTLNIFLKK